MKTIYENRKRVTRMMARCSQGVAKVYPRCSQALAILMSMLRVWLEYAWKQPRVWLEYAYSEITAHSQRDYSSLSTRLRLTISLLLMLTLGSRNVWGQTKLTDGVYYIGSRDYNVDNTTTNYYLCPTEDWKYYQSTNPYYTDSPNGQPFLTTYRCRDGEYDSNKALWVVKESSTEEGWYYIIHLIDGRYLTYNAKMASGSEGRMRAHLEDTADGDNALFKIAYVSGTGSAAIYEIITKNFVNDFKYLNITGAKGGATGNQPSLQATNVRNDGPGNMNVGGILGLWTAGGASDNNSKWYPESNMLTAPTISDFNPANGKVTVTVPEWLPAGYNIRYTFGDGSQPAPTATTETYITNDGSENEIPITTSGTLKVLVERYGVVLTEVATKAFAGCETPVITYDSNNSEISITCVTEGSTIYYTTNGTPPTASSTPYSNPFSVDDQTTIMAIATKSGYIDSEIASVRIVLTPTITLAQTEYTYNGSSIEPEVTSVMDGTTPIDVNEYTVSYTDNIDAGTATVNIEDIAGDDLIVSGSANFTINPKAVTITANDALKAYNGIALTESGFTITALETGDTHTFTVVMTEGSTITNIGTEPNVIATVDGTAVTTGTETAIGNYLVTTANGTLTVNPKAVTITANDASKAYDGTALTESGFTITALETGDTHTFTVVMTEGSTITNIGTEPNVIATVDGTAVTTDTETAIGNYLVTTANGTLTITPKPLTITAGSDTKVYDSTPLTKNSYTHTELLTGDKIEGVTVTGSQTNAGTSDNVLSAAVIKNSNDDDVTANYHITYTNGTLTVTPKPITVKADNKWKAYGEADPRLTYTSGGLLNNDAITGTLSRVAGENVGTYAITVGGLTAGDNYEISFTGANLTIVKAELTVTANNHTITYGDAPAGNGVTCEGFVGEETSAVLGGTLAYDFSYTQFGDVGNTYTIKPKGLTSSNYEITFSTGKLTVSPKEVGLTWSETTSFPYDGSPHAPTATATELVNGDKIGVTVSGAETNAGDHTATASALTGTKKHNYKLPEANAQSFTIMPKSIGDGTTLADGYTLNFGENNTILLTDDVIGSALVLSTDYSVGEDTDTSEGYSERTVTGKGNYTGSFTVRNASVAFSTDTEQDRWSGTFVAEKKNEGDIGFALPEGFTAFIISDIQGEWAIPEPLNYIPADVPVLLVANHQTQGFVVTEAESEKVTAITPDQKDKNMLEKVTEDTPGYNNGSAPFTTKQIYLLYKNEFVFNKAGNLKKGKVYLNPNHTAPSPSPAPARLMIAWNHTTGIEDGRGKIEDGSSERWYTLDGRGLSGKPTTKGLYIVNGKKTVIK